MSAYQEVMPSMVARAGAGRRRAMIAAVIGNTLEWYDFVVYAFLAGTIAKLFFPAGNDTASLLLTLATAGCRAQPPELKAQGHLFSPVGRPAIFTNTRVG
jgi:hypothetical protein